MISITIINAHDVPLSAAFPCAMFFLSGITIDFVYIAVFIGREVGEQARLYISGGRGSSAFPSESIRVLPASYSKLSCLIQQYVRWAGR
jgi:hypothetical protein